MPSEPIKNRSQLIYALTEVAQLEHMLMCQYLFAGASLKMKLSDFSHPERKHFQLELVRAWKKELYIVAREEMQHLTYAINLLISVGGSATFARPNFPVKNRFYKNPDSTGLTMALKKFDAALIQQFINFEAPPPADDKHVPDPNYYDNLHEFYTAIADAFTPEMFVDYQNQYDPIGEDAGVNIRVTYRKSIYNIVKTVEEAKSLIALIIEEGEGSEGIDEKAHVNRFRKIVKQLMEERCMDSGFEPAYNVLTNPMSRISDDIDEILVGELNLIDKTIDFGIPHRLLQLFNTAYENLLIWLFQVFDRHGATSELRAIETLVFTPYMTEILRPLMEILTSYEFSTKYLDHVRLGAGFEVSSNNFLIPKSQITYQFSIDRLQLMENESNNLIADIEQSHPEKSDFIDDLRFIKTSIVLMRREFESRFVNGWPPKPKDNSPSDIKYSEVPARDWPIRGNDVLQIKFEGWAHCRLSSDPDGAFEKRGVTGNNFALSSEADLDRIIYFQDTGNFRRTHCPPIGVTVTEASVVKMPFGTTVIITVPQLVGALVLLENNPKFEGRNHIVSEDGEPIDPFEICICCPENIMLKRAVVGNGLFNEMTSLQRRGTGRYPVSVQVGTDSAREYLKRIGVESPRMYLDQRIKDLTTDLETIPSGQRHLEKGVQLKFRIDYLDVAKRASMGENVREKVRWLRFFFDAHYMHTLKGKITLVNHQSLPFKIPEISSSLSHEWLIDYHMGFFDSDALSCYVYGELRIPVYFGP